MIRAQDETLGKVIVKLTLVIYALKALDTVSQLGKHNDVAQIGHINLTVGLILGIKALKSCARCLSADRCAAILCSYTQYAA